MCARLSAQILGRRTKNNPCLIGEPGVGKTAVAEGLAQKIASGDVPETIEGKQVRTARSCVIIAGPSAPAVLLPCQLRAHLGMPMRTPCALPSLAPAVQAPPPGGHSGHGPPGGGHQVPW